MAICLAVYILLLYTTIYTLNYYNAYQAKPSFFETYKKAYNQIQKSLLFHSIKSIVINLLIISICFNVVKILLKTLP